MGIALNIFGNLLLLAALLAAAFFVFARVRSEYQLHGRLSRPIAVLQTGYFCVYALCSYVFLDSRLSHVNAVGLFFPLAACRRGHLRVNTATTYSAMIAASYYM
jgi:hypothetical protein